MSGCYASQTRYARTGHFRWFMLRLRSENELILRCAIGRSIPLLDLRLVFEAGSDYSEVSPIEPSAAGGAKLVRAIVRMLREHDFAIRRSVVHI